MHFDFAKLVRRMLIYISIFFAGEIQAMLIKLMGTLIPLSSGLFAASDLSAHEGAGISHFVSQTDHTLAIMVIIGLVGFAVALYFQRKQRA